MRYLKPLFIAVLAVAWGTAAADLGPSAEPPAPQITCTVTCIGMNGRQVPCGTNGPCADTYYDPQLEAAVMPYATRTDLVARFGAEEIDDLAPVDDTGVSARADAVLADVDAEFDAVLSDRFDLPLAPVEYPLLKAAACDVARGRLYDDAAPDRVLGRMSSARKRVARVAAGELHLVDAAGARVAPRSDVIATSAEARFARVTIETRGRAGSGRWGAC